MLECKNVTYSVRNEKILKDVTLKAENGKITVLLGNNGSGKTTLLRAIGAYHECRAMIAGEIFVDSISATELSVREYSSHVALLPQTLPTPPMTVRELVTLARREARSPFSRLSAEDLSIVSAAIDRLGLAGLADKPLSRLSGGERQSAYLAMLIAKGAPNVMLDEPTASLDSKHRASLFNLLYEMREEGRAVLTVLHDLTDACEIADRIIVLECGELVFDGTPREFAESGIPERVFGLSAHTLERDAKIKIVYL